MIDRIRLEAVILQKIKHTLPKHIKGDAHVPMILKPIQHGDTQMLPIGVVLRQFGEHIYFQASSFFVLSNILDDFDRHHPVLIKILAFDNLPKGSLSQDLE